MIRKNHFNKGFFIAVLSLLCFFLSLIIHPLTIGHSSLAYTQDVKNSHIFYLPRVNLGKDWQTTISITNPECKCNQRRAKVTLTAYDKDGLSLGAVKNVTRLRGNKTKTINAQALPSGTESLKVESNGNLIGNTIFKTKDGTKSEVIPAIKEPSRQLDFPALLSYDDLYIYETITLLNPNTTPASVDIIALDKDGYEIDHNTLPSLSSMESRDITLVDIFNGSTLRNLSTVRVTSDSNITGLQLVDYPDVDLVGLPALTTTSKGWMFPIVTKGENLELWAKVGILNTGNDIASIMVEAFDASNRSLGIIDSQRLFPGTTYFLNTLNTNIADGVIPLNTAFLKVTSDQPVSGYEIIGVVDGKGLTAVMKIPEEDHNTVGFEMTGSNDGNVLNAYPMIRMGDANAKTKAGSLGSEEWTENVSTIPGISEIISAPTAAIEINKNAGVSQNNGTSSTTTTPLQLPPFGLTIITHGYQAFWPDLPTWVDEMAVAIANRFGGINTIPIYTMKIIKDTNGEIIAEDLVKGNSAPDFKSAGGAIIKVDWSELSGGTFLYPCLDLTKTVLVGDAILTKLGTDLSGAWLQVPIHLIGHSRGASVNSRLAYDLGWNGIWVDHFTTLDPQPITHCGDFRVKVMENVLFADNNYRRKDTSAPPWGERVAGTYERKLNGIVKGDGTPCNGLSWFDNGTAHEQVHTYYHGTILESESLEGYDCVDHVVVQPEWYEPKYPTLPRQTGYYFSRIGKGDRYSADDSGIKPLIHPRDGLHYILTRSSTINRKPLPHSTRPAWPNATFKPFENEDDYNVQVGSKVVFTYYYQDEDSKLDIMFALDNDTNPFNDSNNKYYKEIGGQGKTSITFR